MKWRSGVATMVSIGRGTYTCTRVHNRHCRFAIHVGASRRTGSSFPELHSARWHPVGWLLTNARRSLKHVLIDRINLPTLDAVRLRGESPGFETPVVDGEITPVR